jgi:HEAT repeat protein
MDTLDDDRLALYLLEWMALGTWAGKPFVVPATWRAPSARMHLYTVFQSSEGTRPSRAERVLIEALHDERPALRQTAAKILGLLRSDSAVPALIEALQDPVEAVRLQVVKALGSIRSPEAVPALISLLQYADEQLSNQIFTALGQIGPAAVPPLIELSKDNSAWVRWHSIRALGETNDLRALPVLVQALADDTDYSVAWVAAKGLIQFDRLSVGPVLRLLMFNDVTPWLVGTASYVLNHQHDPNLDPYIRPVLQQMHQPGFSIGTMLAAQKAVSDLVADGLGEECGLTVY